MISLADLHRCDRIAASLMEAGLDTVAAAAKARRFERAVEHLQQRTDAAEGWAVFVPGRIEVLGKHTDYCGGHSLVCAVERGFCVVAAPRRDGRVRVSALDGGEPGHGEEEICFDLDPQLEVVQGTWANYPMTVARRLARNFDSCRQGVDIAFSSDLPPASGMSSSSALIIATYLVLAAANELEKSARFAANIPGELGRAEYLGTLENGQTFAGLEGDRGVGTFGGSEDHTAILCSRAGMLGQFRYCPTRRIRHLPLPADTTFVVATSGVVAEKTGAAQVLYNRASLRARALVDAWQRTTGEGVPCLADLVARGKDAVAALRSAIAAGGDGFGADELGRRLDHFLAEEALLQEAVQALAGGDAAAFGRCVDRSQQLTHELLDNQVPETRALAHLARQEGALAASAFGAGFGGSVWALVRRGEAQGLRTRWREAYAAAYPARASDSSFFVTGAGPAATQVRLESCSPPSCASYT